MKEVVGPSSLRHGMRHSQHNLSSEPLVLQLRLHRFDIAVNLCWVPYPRVRSATFRHARSKESHEKSLAFRNLSQSVSRLQSGRGYKTS